MKRHKPSFIQNTICALFAVLLSGCDSTSLPPTPGFTPTNPNAFQSTGTIALTSTPTSSSSPANAVCSPAEIDKYKDVVLPLADEYLFDAKEAQKMDAFTDVSLIAVLKQKASARLESLQGIQAPACLLEAHDTVTESFELLISTWESIEAKDYSTANTNLKKSYELLVEAVAKITIVQQG